MCSRKAQCQAPPDNPETGDTYEYHSRERRSCAGQKIVWSTKTYTGGAAAADVRVYTYVCIQGRPISKKTRSMEAGEYGLTSGTWFFAHRLEVVAVAGLLRLSWCVLDGANFFLNFFFRFFFFFERTPPAASMRPSPLASFTSLLVVVYTW